MPSSTEEEWHSPTLSNAKAFETRRLTEVQHDSNTRFQVSRATHRIGTSLQKSLYNFSMPFESSPVQCSVLLPACCNPTSCLLAVTACRHQLQNDADQLPLATGCKQTLWGVGGLLVKRSKMCGSNTLCMLECWHFVLIKH